MENNKQIKQIKITNLTKIASLIALTVFLLTVHDYFSYEFNIDGIFGLLILPLLVFFTIAYAFSFFDGYTLIKKGSVARIFKFLLPFAFIIIWIFFSSIAPVHISSPGGFSGFSDSFSKLFNLINISSSLSFLIFCSLPEYIYYLKLYLNNIKRRIIFIFISLIFLLILADLHIPIGVGTTILCDVPRRNIFTGRIAEKDNVEQVTAYGTSYCREHQYKIFFL